MQTNQEKIEQVTKNCEQLVNAFAELKAAVDQLSESYNKLGELADIRERRLNYDENKKTRSTISKIIIEDKNESEQAYE